MNPRPDGARRPCFEGLENRWLLAADLTGGSPDITRPYDWYTPGERLALQYEIDNLGVDPASGPCEVAFYLSDDATLDGGDLGFHWETPRLRLNPGQSRMQRARITLPENLAEDEYHLLARIDSGHAFAESSEANNVVDFGEIDVLWWFGTAGTRRNVRLTLSSLAGDEVTYQMLGEGLGEIDQVAGERNLVAWMTNDRSAVNVRTRGRDASVPLAHIQIWDGLRAFSGRDVDLEGDFECGGPISQIDLDSVTGATIAIGEDSQRGTRLGFGTLNGVAIDTAGGISSLTAETWRDDAAASSLFADYVDRLRIASRRRRGFHVAAQMTADVTLSGEGRDRRPTLGNVQLDTVTGGTWNVEGDAGMLNADGMTGSVINVSGDVRSVRFGTLDSAILIAGGEVGMLSGNEVIAAGFQADSMRTLMVRGGFSAHVQLTRDVWGDTVLRNARIGGDLYDCTWSVRGEIGSMSVAGLTDTWTLAMAHGANSMRFGVVRDSEVHAAGINRLSAAQWEAGAIEGVYLNSFRISGDRRLGVPGTFTGDVNFGGAPGGPSIGTFTVAHAVLGSTIDVESVGRITVGALWNATILAGCNEITGDVDDFSAECTLDSLTIQGIEVGAMDVWIRDSQIAFWEIGMVRFRSQPEHISGQGQWHDVARILNEPTEEAGADFELYEV